MKYSCVFYTDYLPRIGMAASWKQTLLLENFIGSVNEWKMLEPVVNPDWSNIQNAFCLRIKKQSGGLEEALRTTNI